MTCVGALKSCPRRPRAAEKHFLNSFKDELVDDHARLLGKREAQRAARTTWQSKARQPATLI
jgi:hypothetical protein